MSWYADVFDLVFPNLDRDQANKSRVLESETDQVSEDKDQTGE